MEHAATPGTLVYWDSLTGGLIPARIVRTVFVPADYRSPPANWYIEVETTAARGPWPKGTRQMLTVLEAVPRSAVWGLRRMSGPRILPYRWRFGTFAANTVRNPDHG